jgi:RND family efflux transporter MFP subunit
MRRVSYVIVVVIVGGTAGCGAHGVAQVKEPTAVAASAIRAAVRVTAGTPVRKTLERFTVQPGRIEPFEETPLYARVPGYVANVNVDLGDRVQSGQVLASLSVPEMEQELKQKAALIGQAKAEATQAAAGVRSAEAAVNTANFQVQEAQAALARTDGEFARATAEHARIVELAKQGSVSQKLVDETKNQLMSADGARQQTAARIESAKAALLQAQADRDKAKADEGAAQAHQAVAEADYQRTKTLLDYAQIKSPFDGVITDRQVHTGWFVQPATGAGSKPLLVVSTTKVVRVFVDVPEVEAPLVDVKDPVEIRVQALAGQAIKGAVTRTSWRLDDANRALRVEIDVDNAEGRLRPGMYATVSILLERRENALVLPAASVLRKGEQACCRVVEDGKSVTRLVSIGLKTSEDFEVTSGLADSDAVVLSNPAFLEDGQAVEVMPSQK